jgi:hypothetical protein
MIRMLREPFREKFNNNNNNNNRATGTISKSFTKYLTSMPGKHDIKELQKTAVLGTAHTLREVLM